MSQYKSTAKWTFLVTNLKNNEMASHCIFPRFGQLGIIHVGVRKQGF